MATVTAFTAERMLTIENTTVVDGDIVGDNLILKTREGTSIDAGSVRGPQGVQGPPGPTLPPGSVHMFAGAAAPTGYLMCDGASVSRTTYAALFAAIGTTYGSVDANTFNLPDYKNRFLVCMGPAAWSDVLNEKGGSKDAVIGAHTHTAGHTHPINLWTNPQNADHAHSFNVNSGGHSADHSHGVPGFVGTTFNRATGGSAFYVAAEPVDGQTTGGVSTDHSHNVNGGTSGVNNNHQHAINANTDNAPVTTSSTGSSLTDANLPPYATVNYIIKT